MSISDVQIGELSGISGVRERTRYYIALIAVGGYFLIISTIIYYGWFYFRIKTDEVSTILGTTAGILGTIVGAIVGFYFRTSETK